MNLDFVTFKQECKLIITRWQVFEVTDPHKTQVQIVFDKNRKHEK